MAVLQECLVCHRKQSNKNKICRCGAKLDNLKKSGKARYWIAYRINGKQHFEFVGNDHAEAVASEGKRKGQVAENRILDIQKSHKTTFKELAEWYLEQPSVMRLKSFAAVRNAVNHFVDVFGDMVTNAIQKSDIDTYQEKRSLSICGTTVDTEIRIIKTMAKTGFMEDRIDGTALKVLNRADKMIRKGTNARRRILTRDEFHEILKHAPEHIRHFMRIAIYTGMRVGEIRKLQYHHLDRARAFIRLEAGDTKEDAPKIIPVNYHIKTILDNQLRYVHHNHILTYLGNPITSPGGIKHGFASAVKNAGILYGRKNANGLTFHDIRRTVKTLMAKAGIDKVYRDSILGHSLEGMDKHYMQPTDEHLSEAMDTFTAYMDKESW